MRFIDVTGKTEAEAIEKALQQLGLERDDVSVEVMERALCVAPDKIRANQT